MECDPSDFDRALHASVAETLENMVFMEVSPGSPKAWEAYAEEVLWASLLIHDPLLGEMRLGTPRSLLTRVVSMVFALPEEEVSQGLLTDTLAEILNTVAGRFLKAALPEDQPFQLGLPEQEQSGPDPADQPQKAWYFTLEGEPFCVTATGETLLWSL